jgi:hypothetical protein
MYQLRVYTLKDTTSLEAFRTVQYPRHFASFAEFGMSIQGIWTSPTDETRTKLRTTQSERMTIEASLLRAKPRGS